MARHNNRGKRDTVEREQRQVKSVQVGGLYKDGGMKKWDRDGYYLKEGRVEAEVVLFVAVGTDNLLSLGFPERAHSCRCGCSYGVCVQ